MKNSLYRLFTEEEIPDIDTRRAVNCYHATLSPCNERMFQKCKKDSYPLWRKCPKQTGKFREKRT